MYKRLNDSLDCLLNLIVRCRESEYDYGLNPTPENKDRFEKAKNELEQQRTSLGIKSFNDPEFYEWLKEQGFIFCCNMQVSDHLFYQGNNYLLGKVQQQGKRKTPKGKEYNWYIIQTETNDFKGLETIQGYDEQAGLVLNFINLGKGNKDRIGNRTSIEKEYRGYWNTFEDLSEEDIEEFEKEMKDKAYRIERIGSILGLRFIKPYLIKAKKDIKDPSSPHFNDKRKGREFFASLCAQEILELDFLYTWPIILDNLHNSWKNAYKLSFLYGLANFPSYSALADMINLQEVELSSEQSVANKKAAKEVLEMFDKEGYSPKQIVCMELNDIKEIAKKLLEKADYSGIM